MKIDESRAMPVSWKKDVYYDNDNIEMYDLAIQEFCNKNNVLFVRMLGLFSEGDLADGVHPNAEGHKKIFIKVRDFLREKVL